jgi:hypothetical protein
VATDNERLQLRRMAGELDSDTYTNADLDIFVERASGDLNRAAALVWNEKAGAYADLVSISEAGSSRQNSDLYKHATDQRAYYESLAGSGASAATTGTTTRRIVRQ